MKSVELQFFFNKDTCTVSSQHRGQWSSVFCLLGLDEGVLVSAACRLVPLFVADLSKVGNNNPSGVN